METGHGQAPAGHTDAKGGAVEATRQGIAIVSFVAIAIIGMAIAVYAARFVPSAVGGLGSAAAYVSSLFVPSETPTKKPDAEKPATTATTTAPTTPNTSVTTPTITPTKPVTTKPGTPAPVYSGYADLTATVLSMGYCATRNQATFIASNSIPSSARYGGATFMFSNAGTNIAPSGWQYRVDTSGGSVNSYGVQLYPGQSAAGIVCFDRDNGSNYMTVTVDSASQLVESNERNNTDSRTISASGSGSSNNNNDDLWCDITASDKTIDDGDTTTLRWNTEGADEARINQGVGVVDEDGGTKRVHPSKDTTYRLTVENDDGDTETCSVTIRVD